MSDTSLLHSTLRTFYRCAEISECLPNEARYQVIRPVTTLNFRRPFGHRRFGSIRCRGHVCPPQRVTKSGLFVIKLSQFI